MQDTERRTMAAEIGHYLEAVKRATYHAYAVEYAHYLCQLGDEPDPARFGYLTEAERGRVRGALDNIARAHERVPAAVVVDVRDGYTWARDLHGDPFTEGSARAFAEQYNGACKPEHRTCRVYKLTAL